MQSNDEILIKKLEELNKEYLNSNYYQLGKHIMYLKNLAQRKRFIKLFQMMLLHFKKKEVKKEDKKTENSKTNIRYIINQTNKKKKIAIYTCITGNYDNVEEPLLVEGMCDYFLFTNNPNIKSESWTIKSIPEEVKKIKDNAKINRYIKMHPKELFKDYDYSIYIDGNIKIITTLSQMTEKTNNTIGLAIHRHCTNNCIFQEIKDCRAYGKGSCKKLKRQAKRYKKEGFPVNYGMLECNVLVSDLKNNTATDIFDEWWKEYLNSESMRDQIALPYVLWKKNIQVREIGNLGNNVNINPSIKINSHI